MTPEEIKAAFDATDTLEHAIARFMSDDGYPMPEHSGTVWLLRQSKWSIESELARTINAGFHRRG